MYENEEEISLRFTCQSEPADTMKLHNTAIAV